MSILRWLAVPLSPLYGAVVRARNRSCDAHPERAARVGVPVLSVGNLSTGGTGKTPLTLFLAETLETAGWRNAVLSRGYGGRREVDPMSVEPGSNPRETGDEPLLMARRLGAGRVVVGRKRHAAALRALAQRPDLRCLLLDDGFQHRALHRDLDLLVLDGVRRWGNGRMLKDFGKIDPAKPVHVAFGEPLRIQGSGAAEHQRVVEFIRENLVSWGGNVAQHPAAAER